MIAFLLILLLVLANALFVAAEFALIAAPRAAIARRATEGHGVARLVASILKDPSKQDQYIATSQLGITFASLGLGMYGEHVLATALEKALDGLLPPQWHFEHLGASVVAVAFLTYLHIVIGEMVPKSRAQANAETASLWTTPALRWTRALFYPLVVVLNSIGGAILRLIGIDRTKASVHQYYTPEDLEFIIEESREGGTLRAEAGHLLTELLHFSQRKASTVMRPRVHVTGIEIGSPAFQVRRIIARSARSRYPVYAGSLDSIRGFVHIKDLLQIVQQGRALEERDLRALPFLPETATVEDVLRAMRREKSQMVVVMDEHGGTAGIITEKDLLDELVGDVEEDQGEPDVVREDSCSAILAGTVTLAEAGEELGVDLVHPEVDTVSGLILALLGRPPVAGDTADYGGLQFCVLAVEGRGVRRARARRVALPPPA